MITIKDRIKQIRKDAHMTQQDFADRIGVKRNSLANYEIGRNTPIDAIIVSICREFNVNENWLRTGEGEPYVQRTDNQMMGAMIAKAMQDRPEYIRRLFLTALSRISDDQWDRADQMLREVLLSNPELKNFVSSLYED